MKKGYNYYKGSKFRQEREGLETHSLDMIRTATKDILENGSDSASKMSYEELYRNIYNLVLSKRGDTLYSDLTKNLKDRIAYILAELKKSPDPSFLDCLSLYWKKYDVSLKYIKSVFIYFDKNYTQLSGVLTVHELGIELFIKEIMSLSEIQNRIQRLMIDSIESSRRGDVSVNLETIKHISDVLISLTSSAAILQQKIHQIQQKQIKSQNYYETIFESKFIQLSSQYYLKLSQSWIKTKLTTEYLEAVDSIFTSESNLCTQCMNSQTLPKIESVFFSEFIGRGNIASTLINSPESGLNALMDSKKYPELGLMRRLFDHIPAAHQLICNSVKKYIASLGSRMTSSSPAYDVYTNELLCMHQETRKFLGASFGEDVDFAQAIDGGFEIFMNEYADTPAHLARYIHEMLTKGARSTTTNNNNSSIGDNEIIDSTVSEIVGLFRHIHDKDRFEVCYRKYLAARLLTGRSVSIDAEHRILAIFKAECGSQYTSKADGMFRDIQFSEDLSTEFQSQCTCPIKMNVSVLSSHLWSLKVPAECTLPKIVMDSCYLFEEYFTKKYDSRKFTWLHSLGIADVKVVITPTKVYSFLLSAHQLAILSNIFADDTSIDVGLTVERLAELTKLPRGDVRRCLTLFCRTRLITCWLSNEKTELNPKQIPSVLKIDDSNDKFYVNKKFAYKSHRVNLATLKESSNGLSSSLNGLNGSSSSNLSVTSSSSSSSSFSLSYNGNENDGNDDVDDSGDVDMGDDNGTVDEERKAIVDSAIVRIMKSKKVLSHNELISEVTEQVKSRFVPNSKLLKYRIEHLIESEYIKRNKKKHSIYEYIP